MLCFEWNTRDLLCQSVKNIDDLIQITKMLNIWQNVSIKQIQGSKL